MKVYDVKAIMDILPHRENMLLVDKIKLIDEKRAEGKYFFRGEEWFFRGHYPHEPIVPGVILCEIMAQTSCVLLQEKAKGKIPYLVSIDKAKFRQKVTPRKECTTILECIKNGSILQSVEGKLYVEDALCAECTLEFVFQNMEKNEKELQYGKKK